MVCLHLHFITLSKSRLASLLKQPETVPTPVQSSAPQLTSKGNVLAQYLLQAKSHWICQWTHSFAAHSYTFIEVKWSLIRAKLPSVGTFSLGTVNFFLPLSQACLRYQITRNQDKPKTLLESKLLSGGNEPTMTELQHNLCTIEEPGPTGCHQPSHSCAALSRTSSLPFPLVNWNMALSMKDLKSGLCWPRRGCLAGWRVGKYFSFHRNSTGK